MNQLLQGKHIFISYIEENKDIAHIIWDKLDALGATPWAYTKNDDANRWRKEIVRSIKNSDIMILVFSSKTDENADKQIVREIGLASKHGLEIIPFMIDDIDSIENEDLAYELEGINWIRNTKPIEKQIEKLIERIYRHYNIVVKEEIEEAIDKKENQNKNNIEKPQKKRLWIKWLLGSVLFLFVLLVVGVFITKYILHEDNKINVLNTYSSESEFISPELNLRESENDIREKVQKFLKNFYKAGESNSAVKAAHYYVDRIEEYFKFKDIGKDKIIEDKIRYYKKFPTRKYDLVEFEIVNENIKKEQQELLVYSTIKWKVTTLNNDEKSGQSTQILKLLKKHNNYLVKSIRTIDKIENKNRTENNNKFFVCYKKDIQSNGHTAYIGCIKTDNFCLEGNLKHFGKYKTKMEQDKALSRCINAMPNTLYNAKVFNLGNTKDGYLAFREAPNGKLIQKLYNGEKLGVLEKKDKWLKVKLLDGDKIGWVFGKWVVNVESIEENDITLRLGKSILFGTINAKIVSFGGIQTPECKFAISLDGEYFYYKKLNSTCIQLENSNKVKIVCNSNKSICKTRNELIKFIKN